jgi:acetylornithine deacetylase/succinyl-diaminopimelate desuccinylase-like protein
MGGVGIRRSRNAMGRDRDRERERDRDETARGELGILVARGAALLRYAAARRDRYLDDLDQLCGIDSASGYAPGVTETAEWIGAWGKARGWKVRSWPDAKAGDGVIATLDGGKPDGLRLMMLTHHDTAYPAGTVQQRRPRRRGDTFIGPGAIDAKGCALLSLYALAALADNDLLGPFAHVSLLSTPDEETTRRVSAAMIDALGGGYDVAVSTAAAIGPRGDVVAVRDEDTEMGTLARSCGKALGLEFEAIAGEGSPLVTLCRARGLAVVDGFGPLGGMAHSAGEYLAISSVAPRVALLALFAHALAQDAGHA